MTRCAFPSRCSSATRCASRAKCIDLRESKSRPNAGIVTWAHRAINQRGETVCTFKRSALLLKTPAMSEPRSWLFVPADSERKIAKALASEADAIILDLEDSVAPAQKPAAREIVRDAQARRTTRPALWVRVNPLATDYHKDDLDVLANPRDPRHRPAQGRKRHRRRASSPAAPATSRSTPSSPKPRPACSG